MAIKGYIEGGREECWLVGARDKKSGYDGPVAQVSADKNWLTIQTDPYEGSAMLNIEALPYLRKALSRIAKQIRAKAVQS